MKQIVSRIKPASGFGHIMHMLSLLLFPAILYILVRLEFIQLAVALVLFSKWRIFAVGTRHWLTNIRANAVDIFVGVSTVLLMAQTDFQITQLIIAALYAVWLIYIKPRSSEISIGIQAMIAQTVALYVVYDIWADKSILWLTVSVGIICFICARHFMSTFDSGVARTLSYCWGYLTACLAWLTSHWLIYYGPLAQPVLIITVAGYGLAALYYLQYNDRLSIKIKKQVVVLVCATVFVIIMYSGSADKIVQ
ncbi:MAG: hypothetical protein M3Q70_02625 [bacterium]|nr:hypothetical protein [bacterium]